MAACVAGQAKYFFPSFNTGYVQFSDPAGLPALIEAAFLSEWHTPPASYTVGSLYAFTEGGMPALGADVSWSDGGASDTQTFSAVVMCDGDPVAGGESALEALQTQVTQQAAAISNLQTQLVEVDPMTAELQMEYFAAIAGFLVIVWLADRVRRYFWPSGGDHV